VDHALEAEHSEEIEALAAKEQRRSASRPRLARWKILVSTCSVPLTSWN
jgi:hypothetical protein